jgi:hypothetical protein
VNTLIVVVVAMEDFMLYSASLFSNFSAMMPSGSDAVSNDMIYKDL